MLFVLSPRLCLFIVRLGRGRCLRGIDLPSVPMSSCPSLGAKRHHGVPENRATVFSAWSFFSLVSGLWLHSFHQGELGGFTRPKAPFGRQSPPDPRAHSVSA